ncbi:MAG: Lrp/AsnC ligand binding domain-containing protein [Desulfurococcales archaeon]|nr:Lrp/AsnC ligand binding domain-containing protein [Desulfurococcales archaeon]
MTKAIIMINTDVGKEDEIMEKLFELEEVKDVFLVYGIHDIVAIVETETMDQLRSLITEKIRQMDGVKNTLTSIVVTHKSKTQC